MSYIFGREIAKFTLRAYQPGDEMWEFNWDKMQTLIDPIRLAVLKDDETSDGFVEVMPQEHPDDPFRELRLKALKPVWVVTLECFSGGGLDFERSEGFIEEQMPDWAIAAAEIFQKGAQPIKLETDLLISREIATRQSGEISDWFYASFNSWWTGGHCYYDDDPEFIIEFVGELDLTKCPIKS